MRKKLRSRGGFTLSELLTAVAILGLLTAAVAVGVPTALRVYQQVTIHSEASVLCNTISAALADELRQAAYPDESNDSFYSANYGGKVSVNSDDAGRVCLGAYHLLSEAAYTSGLRAKAAADYREGRFEVTVEVYGAKDSGPLATAEFTLDPLNP